ncbi:acyl carrier protein [Amycolatopsis sp. Hca4]|uniref:acyl carrier protein n=1 Tax=Amycolatopsis sp. Hca4 TaxID=2742131 RepID=UPI0015906F78|nr:acyl carrier protein [Amycolatopsis sp. Hca4]QKV74067.1 acyl carrier protein [Amycolatopsis sp. Hca4]
MKSSDDVARVVVGHLSAALGVPVSGITLDAQLTHLENASSLRLLTAVAAIEDELGLELDPDDLVRVRTVADFANLVEAGTRLGTR